MGNELIIYRGGISFIIEPTSRDLVPRETHVTLFLGHVGTKHEQRIAGTTEVVSQYVSGLQTLYWYIIERADGKPRGDGWHGQGGSTYPESIMSIGYPCFSSIQGVDLRHKWLPVIIDTT